MAQSTTIQPNVSMYQRFLNWRANWGRLTELDDLQEGDLTRIASDIGVSPTELRSLAATGAGSADCCPAALRVSTSMTMRSPMPHRGFFATWSGSVHSAEASDAAPTTST